MNQHKGLIKGSTMNKDELKLVFDQQAVNSDQQWKRMAPINNGISFYSRARSSLGVFPTNC